MCCGIQHITFHLLTAGGGEGVRVGSTPLEPTLTTPDSDCIKLQYYYLNIFRGWVSWVGDTHTPSGKEEGGGGLPPCCDIFLAENSVQPRTNGRFSAGFPAGFHLLGGGGVEGLWGGGVA